MNITYELFVFAVGTDISCAFLVRFYTAVTPYISKQGQGQRRVGDTLSV